MTRLIALLAMVAVTLVVSARIYQDHGVVPGLIVLAIGLIIFVLPPYYRLMGLTSHDDETKG
ncbi:hypothetical protein AB0L65_20805 [Nonomuraea sp. NPDC052116]|uniref:hypothetical protein n=1 Tax=Nonomuraea sp. NPDC052116 TaxID=3155665 RepID=UPI00343DBADD